MMNNTLGLYIHIPFCKRLCSYCDFPKFVNQKKETIDKYLEKLLKDIDHLKEKEYVFDTLYIGGGTPNLFDDLSLERLFKKIDTLSFNKNAEKTIECNLEFITLKQASIFKKYGINRISIGVETFNKRVGNIINRYSDFNDLKMKVQMLNKVGINNINYDLIYALPRQRVKDLKKDLKLILKLKPYHLSFYQLILEEKSVLYMNNITSFPKEDDVLKMDLLLKKKLRKYHHYEISNYALAGYESKHNLTYWNLDEYLGIGLSASSLYRGKRKTNSKVLSRYLEDLDIETVDSDMGEFFFMGLRKLDGVSINDFKERYLVDPFKKYDLDDLLAKELITIENDDIIKLTEKGLPVANIVFSYFV